MDRLADPHPGRGTWSGPIFRAAGPLQPGGAHRRAGAAPAARGLDLAVTGWAPLGGGLLTGRYGTGRERPTDRRVAGVGGAYKQRTLSERNLAIADAVNQIAGARDASASQVAIAWVRAQQRSSSALMTSSTGVNASQICSQYRSM